MKLEYVTQNCKKKKYNFENIIIGIELDYIHLVHLRVGSRQVVASSPQH